MVTRSELRLRLFNAYATQLAEMGRLHAEFPKVEDTFLCPFCLQTFQRDALDEPPRLSVEHCIPDAVGGTVDTSTLTCKSCNNGMGSAIDAHLSRKCAADEFLAGVSSESRRIFVEVGEGRARADLKVAGATGGKPKLFVTFDRKRSKPCQFDAAVRAIDEGVANPAEFTWKLDIDMQYSPRRYRVALLRIGILTVQRGFRSSTYAAVSCGTWPTPCSSSGGIG